MQKSKKVSIYLNPYHLETLGTLQRETGLKRATIVRAIVVDYLLALKDKDLKSEASRLSALA